jgi:hypothetical protein
VVINGCNGVNNTGKSGNQDGNQDTDERIPHLSSQLHFTSIFTSTSSFSSSLPLLFLFLFTL